MSDRGWTRFASGAEQPSPEVPDPSTSTSGSLGRSCRCSVCSCCAAHRHSARLKQRTVGERLHPFGSIAEVAGNSRPSLAARAGQTRLERQPGQKEERWAQLLGAETHGAAEPESQQLDSSDNDRVAEIEARLGRLEHAFDDLLSRLDKGARPWSEPLLRLQERLGKITDLERIKPVLYVGPADDDAARGLRSSRRHLATLRRIAHELLIADGDRPPPRRVRPLEDSLEPGLG